MKPTLEQLNELQSFDIRYLVAEKLGLPVSCNLKDNRLQVATREGLVDFDPVSNPNDYMPIAIEYGIDIKYTGGGNVFCAAHWPSVITPKAQTGRAVCTAFLLMDLGDK